MVAERVGFEPTWRMTPTRFRDEPLKPLGHPSAESLPVRKELLDVIGGAGTYYAGIGVRPFFRGKR